MLGLLAGSIGANGEPHGGVDRFGVEKTIPVNVKTLSDALKGIADQIDFLKVDVQGLEFEVLATLGNYRPFTAIVECSSTEFYIGQKSLFEVGAAMRNLGYFPLTLLPPHPILRTDERVLARTLPLHGDIIFAPDNSQLGRAVIARDPLKWLVTLGILGHLDFAIWQAKEIGLDLNSLS